MSPPFLFNHIAIMRGSYRRKLFLNYLVLFVLLSAVLLVFQWQRERLIRRQMLGQQLGATAYMANQLLDARPGDYGLVERVLKDTLRLTVIDLQGQVLFDNLHETPMDNHMGRPELEQAQLEGSGDAVRLSSTFGCRFFYYAEAFPSRYVRVAMPYNIAQPILLGQNGMFLFLLALLFTLGLLGLLFVSDRFGRAISVLRRFAMMAREGEIPRNVKMPRGELGDVGREIIQAYTLLDKSNRNIRLEQEKMRQHFMHMNEGVAMFTAEGQLVYSNSYFVQYLNLVHHEPVVTPNGVFDFQEFAELRDFRDSTFKSKEGELENTSKQICLAAGSARIQAELLIFSDRSHELVLRNVTQAIEQKKLKREMSSNIEHELRTPVTMVQGYLETLLNSSGLSGEQSRHFLEKAYQQSKRLADLIGDITTLSMAEEVSDRLRKTCVDLGALFDATVQELEVDLEAQHMQATNALPAGLMVQGDAKLLESVVRNLLVNSIRYAGQGAQVSLKLLADRPRVQIFAYADTGVGVPPAALARLFERFYRVEEGRARSQGGSGLGLAIVKNVILAHGGEVYAKNVVPHGLEIQFTLPKR